MSPQNEGPESKGESEVVGLSDITPEEWEEVLNMDPPQPRLNTQLKQQPASNVRASRSRGAQFFGCVHNILLTCQGIARK